MRDILVLGFDSSYIIGFTVANFNGVLIHDLYTDVKYCHLFYNWGEVYNMAFLCLFDYLLGLWQVNKSILNQQLHHKGSKLYL